MDGFKDRIAIVTGAGSGIGRALALELAKVGAKVVITDVVQDRLDQVERELKSFDVETGAYLVDHGKYDQVQAFTEKVLSDWGHVDIMCLNAGVGIGARIEEMTIEDWEWLMAVNLWGAIYMVQLLVPRMIERKQGRILITASGAGLTAIPGMAPYCTSKFAMVGLGESLRIELIKHNIKVSVLCPGVINTNIVKDSKILLKDESGKSPKDMLVNHYGTRGTDPAIVAKDGLRALFWDIGIMPSPLHAWPPWILRRISPSLYQALARLVYKKGWVI